MCQNVDCRKYIVFVYESNQNFNQAIPSGNTIPLKLVHHYPTKEGTTHESIPLNIADSYKEGVRCMNVNAHKGATLLFRRALQEICEDKGAKQDKKLNEQIDEIIPPDLSEMAHEVRNWGNIGGHTDDIIKDVKPDDSKQMKELLDMMFQYLYIMPWKVQQSRDKRSGNS